MKKFAALPKLNTNPDFSFLSYIKDKNSAGYLLHYYKDPLKAPDKEDWFLDLDELLEFTFNEYNIEKESWKY